MQMLSIYIEARKGRGYSSLLSCRTVFHHSWSARQALEDDRDEALTTACGLSGPLLWPGIKPVLKGGAGGGHLSCLYSRRYRRADRGQKKAYKQMTATPGRSRGKSSWSSIIPQHCAWHQPHLIKRRRQGKPCSRGEIWLVPVKMYWTGSLWGLS